MLVLSLSKRGDILRYSNFYVILLTLTNVCMSIMLYVSAFSIFWRLLVFRSFKLVVVVELPQAPEDDSQKR